MVSTPQQDLIDDLLVDYLAALDLYQQAQAHLSESLKRGYFDLARSKQALGPLRMSQNSYDLGETLSRVQVTFAPFSSSSTTEDGKYPEHDLDWTLGPSPSSLAPPPAAPSSAELSSSSTLRQRTATNTPHSTSSNLPTPPLTPSSSAASKVSNPPSEPTPRPLSRSPLLQFSAFPPPALRSAETEFAKAMRGMVGVVEAQRRVERLERRVEAARRDGREE